MDKQILLNFEKMFGEGSLTVVSELDALQKSLPAAQAAVIERFIDM